MKIIRLGAVGFMIALLVSMVSIIVYPSAQDFMKANPFWNGIRDFSAQNDVKMIGNLATEMPLPEQGVLIAIPYMTYSQNELDAIASFVTEGGTLLVLDDYGYGNQLMEALELNIIFDGDPMLDPYQCYRNQWLPVVKELGTVLKEAGLEQLVLNHATAITVSENAEVLAYSSETSFLDRNQNEVLDEGEPRGPFPVVVKTDYGQGVVAAVSDPSVLINSMVGRGDNERLLVYLISLAGDEPDVALDESHIPKVPLDRSKSIWEEIQVQLNSTYRQAILAGFILIISSMPLWRKGAKIGKSKE